MDEASDEEQHSLGREAATRADRFWALGYREGLDQGKEAVLEAGFQRGYAQGMQAGSSLGRAQGILTALQALQGRLQGGAASAAQLLAGEGVLLSPAGTELACQALLGQLSSSAEPGADSEQARQQARAAADALQQLQSRAQAIQAVLQRLQTQEPPPQ